MGARGSSRVVALAMKKGGVGKTTSTVALASIAAERGLTVGVIDLDSQGSATQAFGLDQGDDAAEVLLAERPLDGAWTDTPAGVRVVRSGPGTEGAQRRLAGDPLNGLTALRRAIDTATRLPDLVLLDTPPDESHATLTAFVAATEVWAVVEPVPAAIEALPRLLSTVSQVAGSLNPGVAVTAIIPTRFDRRTRVHAGGVTALRATFPGLVTMAVPASTKAVEAHGARVPLPVYAPLCSASIAYREVASRLFDRDR